MSAGTQAAADARGGGGNFAAHVQPAGPQQTQAAVKPVTGASFGPLGPQVTGFLQQLQEAGFAVGGENESDKNAALIAKVSNTLAGAPIDKNDPHAAFLEEVRKKFLSAYEKALNEGESPEDARTAAAAAVKADIKTPEAGAQTAQRRAVGELLMFREAKSETEEAREKYEGEPADPA